MTQNLFGIPAALTACLLLVVLPSCSTIGGRQSTEPAPHFVSVVDVDGTIRSVPAGEVGVGGIERGAFADMATGVAIMVYAIIGLFTLVVIGIAAFFESLWRNHKDRDRSLPEPYRN